MSRRGRTQRSLSDSFLIKQLEQHGNNIYFVFVLRNLETLPQMESLAFSILKSWKIEGKLLFPLCYTCAYTGCKIAVWVVCIKHFIYISRQHIVFLHFRTAPFICIIIPESLRTWIVWGNFSFLPLSWIPPNQKTTQKTGLELSKHFWKLYFFFFFSHVLQNCSWNEPQSKPAKVLPPCHVWWKTGLFMST